MARHTAKSHKIRKVEILVIQTLNGKFVCAIDKGEKIEVGQVTLDYMLDTKGFYQPIYKFDVKVNEQEQSIQIPAIKK